MTTPSFYGLVTVWNNRETIYACLDSLAKFCDQIICLEGKWIGYEGEVNSTDGTRAEIRRFMDTHPQGSKLCSVTAFNEEHQYEARNCLLEHVPVGHFYIMLDSDEVMDVSPIGEHLQDLVNEWLKIGAKGVCIPSKDEVDGDGHNGHMMDLPKIMLKTKGLHYTTNHRYLDDDEGKVIYGGPKFPQCWEFLFTHKGKKATRKQADAYKEWLVKWENHSCKFEQNP